MLTKRNNDNTRSLDFLGFPNYTVTKDGELFDKNGRKLKPFIMKKGYHKYILYNDSEKKTYLVHQLVALSFIPNPNNYDTVDHKDNNPDNNNIDNLQWLPNDKNASKSWVVGNHDSKKKAVLQILDNKVIGEFESFAEASREVGVDYSNISRACKTGGKSKGFHWKLKD